MPEQRPQGSVHHGLHGQAHVPARGGSIGAYKTEGDPPSSKQPSVDEKEKGYKGHPSLGYLILKGEPLKERKAGHYWRPERQTFMRELVLPLNR